MSILLIGANGYIGMRLLPVLVEVGHEVTCVVRDRKRFQPSPDLLNKISIIEFDFLNPENAVLNFNNKKFDKDYLNDA